jgi:hypothetical protein
MAREIATLTARIFAERRKAGRTDLEAIEMALRDGLHQLGTAVLTGLLQGDIPPVEQRQLPCPCGRSAHYIELRSKTLLTVVGEVPWRRAYYLCAHCGKGQFPADVDLDVRKTSQSPGVRRMLAAVGHASAFDQGRRQIELLAGLKVTTKAVERTAEVIGQDILARQQREIRRAKQLELPVVAGPPDSDSLHPNRWHRRTCGDRGDARPAGQTTRSARAHARSQTRLRLHPDRPERGGSSGARRRFDQLCRCH